MFTYQKTNRFFAQIAGGLDDLGVEELEGLGAVEVKAVYRGIYFTADTAALYRIIYRTRLCSRITAPLLRFDCHSTKYLYKTAIKIPWHELLTKSSTLAISATVTNSRIKHSQYAALCLKDAVVDYFRAREGCRPDVDTINPDIRLHLHIEHNKATISLDAGGGSLHRRGYRRQSVQAPMQETLAAAIIRLTKWDGNRPLLDPMCGSGTLLSEALMHYCRIPAAFLRKRFGFEAMPDYDAAIWQTVRREADQRMRVLPAGLLGGRDLSSQAIAAAIGNNQVLPQGKKIIFKKGRFQKISRINNTIIVINPPYGIRLDSKTDMAGFMKELGDFLKQRCKGSTAYLYLGKQELVKKIGLKPAWKKPLRNGPLAGVLAKYEIY